MTLTSGAAMPNGSSKGGNRALRAAGFATIIAGSALAIGMLVQPTPGTAAGTAGSRTAECGHQRNTNDPTNSHQKTLDSYSFDITHNGNTITVCDLNGHVHAGDTVTANFTMDPAAPDGAEVTLVSNNAPPPTPHQQTLFECASFGDTSGAGDPCASSAETSLTVTVPDCGFQVDLIYGETISPLTQGTYLLQHRFVSGDEGKNPTCVAASIATTPVPTTTTTGQPIKDTATVTPSSTTGTVAFNLFGPTDANCSRSPVFSSTGALSGGTATSGSFTPTIAGTYHWTASMSNPALNSACADEPVTITPLGAGPTPTPTPSPTPAALGTPITAGTPSTGVELPLPLGGGLILAGVLTLIGESRTRRRLG